MTNKLKVIRKASQTSVEIAFIFNGKRCRERLKISSSDDWQVVSKHFRDRIISEIKNGTFNYSKTFPRSLKSYTLSGKRIPEYFRQSFVRCHACGKEFVPKPRQIERSKEGKVHCSKECFSHTTSGYNYQVIPDWCYTLLAECKKRASRKNVEYSLDNDFMIHLLRRSGWKCEVSGIHFEFGIKENKGYNLPYHPSLDRIDSSKGYTQDNIRIVCLAANIAMNTWGDKVLLRLAKGVVETLDD